MHPLPQGQQGHQGRLAPLALGLTAPQHPDAFYIWPYRAPTTFTASAAGATATFKRALDAGVPQHETVESAGFFGSYYAQHGSGRHPALLVLGGSEGGLTTGFGGSAARCCSSAPVRT